MSDKSMPSEYIKTLWSLWDNKIVTEDQIKEALKVYGYELQVVNPAGLIAENDKVKHTYKSTKDVRVSF